MKKIWMALLLPAVLVVPSVSAQIYNGKADDLQAPMDRAADQSLEYFANIDIPGAAEDKKAQELRYEEALTPMNQANEKHFEKTVNLQTVVDLEGK